VRLDARTPRLEHALATLDGHAKRGAPERRLPDTGLAFDDQRSRTQLHVPDEPRE
jgi:hypothetical protein